MCVCVCVCVCVCEREREREGEREKLKEINITQCGHGKVKVPYLSQSACAIVHKSKKLNWISRFQQYNLNTSRALRAVILNKMNIDIL